MARRAIGRWVAAALAALAFTTVFASLVVVGQLRMTSATRPPDRCVRPA